MAAEASARLERRLQFLSTDPENIALLAECADLALELGRAGEAKELVQRGLRLKPEDRYLQARLATAHIACGEVADALALLERMVKAGEAAAPVRYNLAYALMLSRRYAEAKEQLVPIAAEMPPAAMLLIRAHHHLGELDEAIRLAEELATAHPEDGEVSAQLAMLYLDASDFTKARAWSDKALMCATKPPEAYFTAGFLALGDEDDGRAGRLLARAVELNPKSGRAWAGKGLVAMLQGDLATAEENLKRAVQHLPDHIGTWHVLAWCQILRGELDDAEASVRKAYELDRAFGETHGALAVIELMRGGGQRVRRRIDTALRLDPTSFAGRYAKVLLEAKDESGRAQGVRAILASQRALRNGTLLDSLSRHTARRRKPDA
jgi:tetratricopeptide (TPR) repeat protein